MAENDPSSNRRVSPNDFRMSFSSHLEELRKRLVICVVALLVGMAISYAYRDWMFGFILQPLFMARESVEITQVLEDDEDDAFGLEEIEQASSPTELAKVARRLSKQSLSSEDPQEAAQLAAKAAAVTAKAVQVLELSEMERVEQERLKRQRSIAYTNPVKPFWVSLQLALVGGVILSFGVILFQIWAFIAPGLYPQEKRYAIPFVVAGSGCFIGGAYFGYRFVFPIGFGFLTRFSREIALAQGIGMMDVTTVDAFVGIALKLLLAFGLVFELPVVISFLALAGIVDHRQLWKFGRWFVVISVIVGAFLTPPDVISQVMMAIPMSILYIISIGLAYILHPNRRKRKKQQEETEEQEHDEDAQGTEQNKQTEQKAHDDPEKSPGSGKASPSEGDGESSEEVRSKD